ncbi:unnamed protein product [Caenorhabditis brenneri]
MVVYLNLTEEIIDSFNKCVKTGDYKPFLIKNLKFLDILVDNLKYVKFEKNSKYDSISKEFRCCLKFLAKFDPDNPREMIPGVKKLENNVPEVSDDIKDGISKKDWSNFYRKYRPDADYMISEARRQGIIDFTIILGSNGFGSFATRDEVFDYMNEELVPLPLPINKHSREFTNSGAFVQYDTEPNVKTNPENLSVITTPSKSPYRVLQKNDNGGKTTNDCTAKTQISTGTTGGVDRYETMPQTIPEPSKKESEKKTFFGFLIGHQKKFYKENPTPKSGIQLNDLDERSKNYLPSNYAADLNSGINYEVRNFDLPKIPTIDVRQASLITETPVNRYFGSEIFGEEDSEDHSYRLADHNFENKSQKIGQVEPPEPPLNDYKEKLARLETEFQMRFKNQEEKFEDFAGKSKLQKENYDSNLQKLEIKIREQLKAHEEQMKLREDKLRMREQELDEKVNEIRSMENHLDKKVDETRSREENLGQKMEEMMETMKMMVQNTAEEFAEKSKLLMENVQEQLKEQEEQMKLTEEKLDKKFYEINSMEKHLDRKIDEIGLREENLGRKMGEMMGMMKLVIGNTAIETPAAQSTEPSVPQSDPFDNMVQPPDRAAPADSVDHEPISEDDELQQMEEQFQRARAEQDRKNELELRKAQERRRKMNERAAEELNRISGNLQRAASFRSSLRSQK